MNHDEKINIFWAMESIAKRLKCLRVQNNLTQAEAATQIGVSPSTYRDWEYGKQIRGEPYERIAQALGVSLTYIIAGKVSQGDEVLTKLRDIERTVETIRKIAVSL